MSQTGATAFDLPADHPGVSDAAYRSRRAAIAAAGTAHRPGQPIADVEYTPEENALWQIVSGELRQKHARLACRAYLDGAARLAMPTDRVPQLREVDARLHELADFGLRPVAGLLETQDFFGALVEREFPCTQYVRHHSVPFYTPEPDVIHELIGHAVSLAHPAFGDLYESAGRAALRTEGEAAVDFFGRVFWFTLEFGVLHEDGVVKAYGSGLLSSFGELEVFRSAEIRPWDVVAMGTQEYDLSVYQPVLFAADSFTHAVESLGDLFDRWDDDAHARLIHRR